MPLSPWSPVDQKIIKKTHHSDLLPHYSALCHFESKENKLNICELCLKACPVCLFFFYCDLSGEVWLFMKETGQNFSSSSQRIWYQQPVTSTLQLKELRCKEPSLSALSEGHQRLRWSESAAALMVWVSPLSLQKNLFVLRMFTDPGEDKQPVSCL